ncbi:MAG: aldehyde dehydrogenase family protein [Gemmatimonadales bacterium]|nr:MAG: aldehyde dehydrogenase family protein [Gemmatimonadales bacterium]
MPDIAEIFQSLEYGPAPESTGPAERWLDAHDRRFGLFVGGRWADPTPAAGADSPERFETRNPATGEVLAEIAQGSEADVRRAVEAAEAALEGWTALGGHGRGRVLYALARGIQKHARLFAVLESLDNGKPIRESRDLDIPLVARHFYHHAGWAALVQREFPDREPHGVVGQIIPWNFPLLMLAWKVAPALACGNTVVLKPAEFTPLTALLFADLCVEAGVPEGVVNIVTGDGRTGAALAGHPGVRKVAFTGSTEVGRILRKQTAGTGKALTLELGGKSPFLVYEDADLDSVVEGVVDAIWFNQGEVCCAGSRILVQEGVAEALVTKLRARMETLRLGDPLDKGIDMGAVVDPTQLERIRELVEAGRAEGAEIWQPSDNGMPTRGSYYPPTLCTGVEPAGTLAQVEIFGPVVVLMTFRTHAESVELANNTRYGLAASVWTENLNLALDVAPKIEAGTVWINCTNMFDAASGFGGVRESGYGREGGREGLVAYLRPRGPKDDPAEGDATASHCPRTRVEFRPGIGGPSASRGLDRTPKLYIGGKQARPDGGGSLLVVGEDAVAATGEGSEPGERGLRGVVGQGNRKDIRNAVEAARKAFPGWSGATAHLRAQVLFYVAENLSARGREFEERLREGAGLSAEAAALEVERSVERLFTWAALADKVDGRVHATPGRNVTLAMVEPVGVIGIAAADAYPLLGLVSTVAPAIALGNTVVVLPSGSFPLAATDLYQVLDTSDLPGGVVNVVTGEREELVPVLADHDDVDALWSFGSAAEAREVEVRSVGNLKRCWTDGVAPGGGDALARNWGSAAWGEGEIFVEQATRVKNIWVPYGA